MDLMMDIANFLFLFIGMFFTVLMILLFTSNSKRVLRRPKSANYPDISVIIPAHNEEGTIRKTVESVRNMSYPGRKEIIVVDDGSSDGTFRIAKSLRVKVFRKKQGGKASALNLGIKHASCEIVACIDSDSYPEKDALMKAMPFFDEGADSVTTSVLVKRKRCLFEKIQDIEYAMVAWTRKMFEFMDAIYVTPGAMSLYRKDVLTKIGGFDERNMAEDIEIAWRLLKNGYKIRMALDAKVYTDVPSTMRSWWRQRIRWNVGGIQTTMKYFHCFTKKGVGSIGTFLLPMFTMSYVLTAVGIAFVIYVLKATLSYLIGAISFGFDPVTSFLMYLRPDIFMILMGISAALTLLLLTINVRTIRNFSDVRMGLKYIILFMTVYIFLFPINLIHSSVKFATGRYEW